MQISTPQNLVQLRNYEDRAALESLVATAVRQLHRWEPGRTICLARPKSLRPIVFQAFQEQLAQRNWKVTEAFDQRGRGSLIIEAGP